MVDVDGRSVEEENLETSPTTDSSTINNTFTKASSNQQHLAKQVNHELKECSTCKELYSENLELKEALAKASQLTTADKVVSVSSLSTSPYVDSIDYNNHAVDDILEFEFPLPSGVVRKHTIDLGDDEKIWFSGRIDKKTVGVISCGVGRIKQEQQQSENTEIAKGANV